ncbi:MAG: hypothetical protein ACYDDO_09500 [Acidiferrobacterales bacterium]
MNTPEKQYRSLSLAERMELALSAELPEIFRPFLASDQWLHVKCYFARRLDLRTNEIAQLLEDPDHVIRLCIAKRTDLSPEQVERCVGDPAANVRYFVARNPLVTEAQRNRLLADPDELVCRAARKGPREPRVRQRHGQVPLVR